mmetsp:Transcript_29837/g.63383  ORF Transcript_29837/g.63383 Transcript_29837/m.63383 type:complete len:107 (+) Transcript_29837:384-704(+)
MVAGSPSVAVRVYTTDDIIRFEGGESCAAGSGSLEGIDGIRNFRDSFEYSIVCFILNNGQTQRDQLGRRDSFVNLAQRDLLLKGGGENDENSKKVCPEEFSVSRSK